MKESIIESGTVHMQLGDSFGQLYTNMLREIAWNNCEYDKAIVKATEVMIGMTNDQARHIIDGKAKLVTKDGGTVKMVDDNWTPPDFNKMRKEIDKIVDPFIYHIPKTYGGPSWFEMLPEKERLELIIYAREIKELAKYNIWKAKDRAKHFDKLWQSKMIENSERFSEKMERAQGRFKEFLNDKDKRTVALNSVLDELKMESIKNIATAPISEEQKKKMIVVIDGQIDAMKGKVEIKIDSEFYFNTAWLSPEGKYYGCKPGQHIELSHQLVNKFYKSEKGDKQQILEFNGWIEVTDCRWYTSFTDYAKRPTRAQLKTVEKWSKVWAEDNLIEWNGKKLTIREINALY